MNQQQQQNDNNNNDNDYRILRPFVPNPIRRRRLGKRLEDIFDIIVLSIFSIFIAAFCYLLALWGCSLPKPWCIFPSGLCPAVVNNNSNHSEKLSKAETHMFWCETPPDYILAFPISIVCIVLFAICFFGFALLCTAILMAFGYAVYFLCKSCCRFYCALAYAMVWLYRWVILEFF